MSKPSTPVRRSKVGPGRPGSAGGEIPLTASMEVLPPDPCILPHLAASEPRRSQELHAAPTGSKPRTPGSAKLVRTRSTDGRRSSGPHEVIPLNSTTSKSISANQILSHPLVLATPAGTSPACSVVGASGVGIPLQSSYMGESAQGGVTPTGSGGTGTSGRHITLPPGARARTPQPDVSMSTASSRFNPVMEDDDDMPPWPPQQQPQPRVRSDGSDDQQGSEAGRESQVLLSDSAVVVAQRVAAVAGSGVTRRYAGVQSVAMSGEQELEQRAQTDEASSMPGDEEEEGRSSAVVRDGRLQHESQVPGTPGSVASGRIGGIFFTDLHRSFGGAVRPLGVDDSQDLRDTLAADDDEEEEGFGEGSGGLGAEMSRQARMSTMTSRLNPMQSPTISDDGDEDEGDDAFAEYAGEELRSEMEAGSGSVEAAGTRRASTSALTDYSNPVQTPYDSRLATPLLPSGSTAPAEESSGTAAGASDVATTATESRKSLLLVIRDLYVTDSEPQTPVENSRPATAASELPALTPATPQHAEAAGRDEPVIATDAPEALAASRATVAELAARTESQQSQRRSELGEYMTALQDLKDESGGRLVELPADWGVMLERLFRQRRAEFETLQGWMGPRRFEDLPINQLPSDHPDPRVEEGLARIRELDTVLNDKLIEALISHRETFPDQWAEQERKRLERHTRTVEEALKRERQKRLRAARISRAVNSLDGPVAQGSSHSLAAQPSSMYSRLYSLKPEEEALVEAVLRRNDDEGAAINPFDLESAATYGSSAPERAAEDDGDDSGDPLRDPDDIDFELDLMLPSASASACATPSAAAPLPRPLSARLTEADDGGGGALRPLSASSYSPPRPGTSSGPAGGMSPLTAAALHGHPALLGAAFAAGAAGARSSAAGNGGLLPERIYDDPRAAARALRAINARLAAFESEHLWDESGALADFKSVTSAQQQPGRKQSGSQQPGTEASMAQLTVNGTVGTGAQSSPGGRAPSPPRSVRSAAGGPAPSIGGMSVTAGGHKDYLREERLAKELAMRERDVDAALRSLKTGEVVRLGEATLKALVEQCRRLQELNEHRRKIEEAEAAARKAQLLRQQVMASRASESGSGRGTPKGTSAPSNSGGSRRGQTQQQAAAASARAGTGPAAEPSDGGSVRGGKPPPGGALGTSGTSQNNGRAGVVKGNAGGATATRQSSAGKSRSSASASSSGQGTNRRASDPAVATSGGLAASGDGTIAASTPNSGSGTSSSSKGVRAPTAVSTPAAAAAASTATVGTATKPKSAGKAGVSQTQPDSRGGLPPPPPPPPP